MGGGAMVSGPSFDNERVAMYEGKTTLAGKEAALRYVYLHISSSSATYTSSPETITTSSNAAIAHTPAVIVIAMVAASGGLLFG
jgi:hypothetical protein